MVFVAKLVIQRASCVCNMCESVCMQVLECACMCASVCTRACIHVCACVSVYMCMHPYAYVCMYSHVYLCVCTQGPGVEGRAIHWMFLLPSVTQWLRKVPGHTSWEPGNR